MTEKLDISYTFITTEAPVAARGSVQGKAFYFRARYNSWSFALAEDPTIQPEDIYSSEQGFYLCGSYGRTPYSASYMSLHNTDIIIRACVYRYLHGISDEIADIEHEDVLFSLYLENPGPNRLQVIACIRGELGLSPAQARTLVDQEQPLLLQGLRREIEQFAAKLQDIGASITIQ